MKRCDYPTCRFCRKRDPRSTMVKYGTRHYAHFDCYLSARKSIDDLTSKQIGRFPCRVMRKHGLLDQADKILAEKNHWLIKCHNSWCHSYGRLAIVDVKPTTSQNCPKCGWLASIEHINCQDELSEWITEKAA